MKVVAIWAQTLDGKIGQNSHDTLEWVSKEDHIHFRTVTQKGGVIVMGKTTFDVIGKPLPDRLNIVLDHELETDFEVKTDGLLEFAHVPFDILLDNLADRGFDTVFISGGSSIYTQFTSQGLVDEWWITIEPIIFGGGVPAIKELPQPVTMQLTDVSKLNNSTVLLKYVKV